MQSSIPCVSDERSYLRKRSHLISVTRCQTHLRQRLTYQKDFFYICSSHLKDRRFCTPIVDEAAEAAKKKVREEQREKEIKEEVERVKKEYEEKKKQKSEKNEDKKKGQEGEKDEDKGDEESQDDVVCSLLGFKPSASSDKLKNHSLMLHLAEGRTRCR
jgi:hypothetical protein